MLNKLSKMLFF